MTPDQFREEIRNRSDDLSPRDYRVYLDFADQFADVKGQSRDASKRNKPSIVSSLTKLQTTMETTMYEAGAVHDTRPGQVDDYTSGVIQDELVKIGLEMDAALRSVISRGIELGHSDEQVDENIRAEIKRIEAEQREAHTGTVPTTSPLREGSMKREDALNPLVLTTPPLSLWGNDSDFAGVVSANRTGITSKIPERRAAAVGEVREAAKGRLEELLGRAEPTDWWLRAAGARVRRYKVKDGRIQMHIVGATMGGEGEWYDEDGPNHEYHATRAIGADPYTPDELEAAKTNGNLDKNGVHMPSEVKNFKRVLYFRNMDDLQGSAEEYLNASEESKGDTHIGRLIAHMPAVDFETFLFTQSSLLGYQGTK